MVPASPPPPGQIPPSAGCLHCREPLPIPHAKTRRYCSASCRTLAYNARSFQRAAKPSGAENPVQSTWVGHPADEWPVLRHARQTLQGVAGTLGSLAQYFGAEEQTLRCALEQIHTQASQQHQQHQDLATLRQQLEERDAELHRLRGVAHERDELKRELRNVRQERADRASAQVQFPRDLANKRVPPLKLPLLPESTSQSPSPWPLTRFPAGPVPDSLREGIEVIYVQLGLAQKFGQTQARSVPNAVLSGFVAGLALVLGKLRVAMETLLTAPPAPAASLPATGFRGLLLQDILPAFDDLYRCVRWLRATSRETQLGSLREFIEWAFSTFLGVLERAGLYWRAFRSRVSRGRRARGAARASRFYSLRSGLDRIPVCRQAIAAGTRYGRVARRAIGSQAILTSWLVTYPQTPDGSLFGDAWTGGELALGARIASLPAALATDRLRGFFFRLRAPVGGALVLLERPAPYGCRYCVGRASPSLRFRRDSANAIVLAELTWRVVRARADLDDVDWGETGYRGFLGRDDVDDEARVTCILAEREISADRVSTAA